MPKKSQALAAAELATRIGGSLIGAGVVLLEETIDQRSAAMSAADLDTCLQLVRGVGPSLEQTVRAWGYSTLQELTAHPIFGPDATICLEAVKRRDWPELKRRGAPVDALVRLFAPPELVFLDIETIGLGFSQEIFLVGTLQLREGSWLLRQAALLSLAHEVELLQVISQLVEGAAVCVTYNGISFDVPFLRTRMLFHDIDCGVFDRLFHADLLYHVRRHYGRDLPNCKLSTVEASVLGIRRIDDMPGAEMPWTHATFAKTQDVPILQRILAHNRQDLVTLRDLTLHDAVTAAETVLTTTADSESKATLQTSRLAPQPAARRKPSPIGELCAEDHVTTATRICVHCGKPANWLSRLYCSAACRIAAGTSRRRQRKRPR